jgi:hypothetical protein
VGDAHPFTKLGGTIISMTYLVSLLQRIAHNYNEEWLSPSQLAAYQYIKQVLLCQDTVNLNGFSGSGKTFVTWVLSKSTEVVFYRRCSSIESSAKSSKLAIVDPQESDRDATRQTLEKLHRLGHCKIIMISTDPIDDQIPKYSLNFHPEDYEHIYQNWQNINIDIDELTPESRHQNLHITLQNFALRPHLV